MVDKISKISKFWKALKTYAHSWWIAHDLGPSPFERRVVSFPVFFFVLLLIEP